MGKPKTEYGRAVKVLSEYTEAGPLKDFLGRDGYSPYPNEDTKTWWYFDDTTQTYQDSNIDYRGAYDLAVDAGYTGTEAAFAEELNNLRNHDFLTSESRALPDAHPMSSITGLIDKLEAIQAEAGSKVTEYDSYFEFPTIGEPERIYIDKETHLMYTWDAESMSYYTTGINYNANDNIINGGSA